MQKSCNSPEVGNERELAPEVSGRIQREMMRNQVLNQLGRTPRSKAAAMGSHKMGPFKGLQSVELLDTTGWTSPRSLNEIHGSA